MTEKKDHFESWEDKVLWQCWEDLPQAYKRLSHRTHAQIHRRRWKLKQHKPRGQALLGEELRFRCTPWLWGHMTAEAARLKLDLSKTARAILIAHFEKRVFAQERGQNRRQSDAHKM